MAAQHTDDRKGCASALPVFFDLTFFFFLVLLKMFMFSIPNQTFSSSLTFSPIKDPLTDKLDHRPQSDKNLPQGLPHMIIILLDVWLQRMPEAHDQTPSLFSRMDQIRENPRPIFAGTHLQDHFGGPQIILCKSSFLF